VWYNTGMKNAKQIATWGVGIAAVVALAGWMWVANSTPGKLDGFAQCLKDEGVVFYGAFWCPHCQNQKTLFGKSQKLLPYTECSTPDGRGQLPVCAEKNVKSYPTWEFPDGSRLTGEIPLGTLAEKTSCALPE
jgi:thiol-disulfide isomerase/thioredoxin